jgi:hypothetical protein
MINNFVINTAVFLNTFSDTIETKISSTSSKLTQLEILLSVLEAKLNSVPGLESSLPDEKPTVDHGTATSLSSQNSKSAVPDVTQNNQGEGSSVSDVQPSSNSLPEEYVPFMKMIKVGIPKFVAQAKAAAAGLDPSILDSYNP